MHEALQRGTDARQDFGQVYLLFGFTKSDIGLTRRHSVVFGHPKRETKVAVEERRNGLGVLRRDHDLYGERPDRAGLGLQQIEDMRAQASWAIFGRTLRTMSSSRGVIALIACE